MASSVKRSSSVQVARAEKKEAVRSFHLSKPQVELIEHHLLHLRCAFTTRQARLAHWRGIIDAAYNGHEEELSVMDELKSVKADPSSDAPIAG